MKIFAYCWRSGRIEFGAVVPEGALPIGSGDKAFRDNIEVKARHAYNGKWLLVPGIPEAKTDADARLALRLFIKWAVKGEKLSKGDIRAARAAQRRALSGLMGHVIVDEYSSIKAKGRS